MNHLRTVKDVEKKCVPIERVGAFVLLGVVRNVLSVSPATSAEPAEQADGNRLLEHAAWINSKLDKLDQAARSRLEEMLEIDPQEATACLEGQARAAARELITSAEALTIYQALTPDGWEPGTRLEVKMTIVSIMDRLLTPLSRPATRWSPSAS
jgi:hypothetical protein